MNKNEESDEIAINIPIESIEYNLPFQNDNVTESTLETQIQAIDIHIQELPKNDDDSYLNGIEFNEFYKNTESTFDQKWNFNDMYIRSNSPMVSNCNSDVEVNSQEIYESETPLPSRFVRKILKREHSFNFEPKFRNYGNHPNVDSETEIYYLNSNEYSAFPKRNKYKREPYSEFRKQNETATQPIEDELNSNTFRKYKKFTYSDIENSLSRYNHKNDDNFNETDLIITYLSGMRAIYVISKNITQLKSY